MTTAKDALTEVRLAYRLVHEYQRTILDLTAHLGRRLADARPGLTFQRWRPLRHAPPPPPEVDPSGEGRWAWELLPGHHVEVLWGTGAQPAPGALGVRMHHLADDGFQLGSGEPRPADFPPAAACMTSLTFRAVAVRRVEAHLGWDDLIAMVPNADGTAWDEGRVHRFDSGANAFWYGGLNIDAVTIASADLAEARLVSPLLKLVRGLA